MTRMDDPSRPRGRRCLRSFLPHRCAGRGALVGPAADQAGHRTRPARRQRSRLPAGRPAHRGRPRRPRRGADRKGPPVAGRPDGPSRSRSSTRSSSAASACTGRRRFTRGDPLPPGSTRRRTSAPEAVARLIGLRSNHPGSQDALELGADVGRDRGRRPPSRPPRSSAGRAGGDPVALSPSATFAPPVVSGCQRTILQPRSRCRLPVRLRRDERAAADRWLGQAGAGRLRLLGLRLAGVQARGLRAGETLAGHAEGPHDVRDEQRGAGGRRIAFASLEPGDLLFFGTSGPRSKPSQIYHIGIYLGGGWIIQSSGRASRSRRSRPRGTRSAFAWARRPLAEAGLACWK